MTSYLDQLCDKPNYEWLDDFLLADRDNVLLTPATSASTTRTTVATTDVRTASIDNTDFIVAALRHLGIKNATQKFPMEEEEEEENEEEEEYDDFENKFDNIISDLTDQITIDRGTASLYIELNIPGRGIFKGRVYHVPELPKTNVDNKQSNE